MDPKAKAKAIGLDDDGSSWMLFRIERAANLCNPCWILFHLILHLSMHASYILASHPLSLPDYLDTLSSTSVAIPQINPIMMLGHCRLLRINVLYRKAVEFRLLHIREHERLTKLLKILQYTMLGITSGVSIILLVFPNEPWVTQVSSIATIFVGLIVSWGRFQSYEARAEGHMISSLDFEGLARDMSTYLATCRPEQIDEEAMDSLHRLANEPDEDEAAFTANQEANRDELQQVCCQSVHDLIYCLPPLVMPHKHHSASISVQGPDLHDSALMLYLLCISHPWNAMQSSSGPGPVAEAEEVTENLISAQPDFGDSFSRSLLRPSRSMMQSSPETSLDRFQRNQRLQLWYHKSVEYRLANHISCERNKRISMVRLSTDCC